MASHQKLGDLVTIVIPVHGALSETLRCLDAVAATAAGHASVLVIDDASPDPAVGPSLADACRRHGFELRTNPANLGFVATCNLAFDSIPEGHVVILNSDTEPQPGWLDAMLRVVGSDIASVTPLSNNASIYSVPELGADPYSDDFSAADLARVSTGVDLRTEALEIPVGVGFCMLMTRWALHGVGGFDPVYGMGYGEEDDWCMRARRKGYRHVLALRAFVSHVGGVSMSAAGVLAKGLGEHPGNARILRSRFPEHRDLVTEFIAAPQIHRLRDAVTAATLDALAQRRTHLMHWLHGDPWSPNAGGTERSVFGLIRALEREYATTVVFPEGRDRLTIATHANGLTTRRQVMVSHLRAAPAVKQADLWRRLADEVLELTGAEVLHLHHGHQTHPAVALAAVERGVPTVVSLHDFNFVCPRNHLLDRWNTYCAIPDDPRICDSCLASVSFGSPSISEWRDVTSTVLRNARRVIVPDLSVLQLVSKAIGTPDPDRIAIIPPYSAAPSRVPPDEVGRVPNRRVLIPGRVEARHKGGTIISDLLLRLTTRGLEVHSVGTDDLPEQDGLVIHGTYASENFPKILSEIDADLAILPSVVPETFSLTVSELWNAGLPVIAPDLGAVGRRIRSTGAGWLSAAASPGALADRTLEVLENPQELQRGRALARAASHQDSGLAERGIAQHRDIYRQLAEGRSSH
jgi:GT2 family glycosyltransferase/glycosyltransferase involved in cell wall biosynthesis